MSEIEPTTVTFGGPFSVPLSTGKLAEALAKAQAQMSGARRDSSNPFFSSKYASLSEVHAASREALTNNGIAVTHVLHDGGNEIRAIQVPLKNPEKTKLVNLVPVVLETILLHSSGERLHSVGRTWAELGPQKYGSAITYLSRQALVAILGLPVVDDDGEDSQKPFRTTATVPPEGPEHGPEPRSTELQAIDDELDKSMLRQPGDKALEPKPGQVVVGSPVEADNLRTMLKELLGDISPSKDEWKQITEALQVPTSRLNKYQLSELRTLSNAFERDDIAKILKGDYDPLSP
jgi:hypothetical protein